MKKISYLAAILAIMAMHSCNNPSNKDSVSMAENANKEKIDTLKSGFDTHKDAQKENSEFAVKAADGGMLEVELGKIALTNASHQDVKDFGQMMVTDHTKINDELKALAKRKDIVLPPTTSNDNTKLISDLNGKKGTEFDKDYIDHMVKDHEKDIEEFEEVAKNSTDMDIKEFANKTLPTLRNHLAAAKKIKDKM